MSVSTIEKILWEFGDDGEKVTAFLDNPDQYLAKYPLTEEEFRMLRRMDFAAMDKYGVSNLLTMMVWPILNGNNQLMMFDYLRRVKGGEISNNLQVPTPVFYVIHGILAVRNAWLNMLGRLGLKKVLS